MLTGFDVGCVSKERMKIASDMEEELKQGLELLEYVLHENQLYMYV